MRYQWTDDLATGNTTIDAQHRRIFFEIEALHKAIQGHEAREHGPRTLKFLEVYIKGHFQTEECFMRDSRYPKLAEHETEHDVLRDTLVSLQEIYLKEGSSSNFILTLNRLCIEWLIHHIGSSDKRMARHLRSRLPAGLPAQAPALPEEISAAAAILRNILVIEDSDLIKKMYNLMFRRYCAMGVAVNHVSDGAAGLKFLSVHPDTDLILTDMNMPGMGGLELIRRCKQNKAYARIPIVVVSTGENPGTIQEARDAGAVAFLTKPFSSEQLYAVLSKITSERFREDWSLS